MKYKTKNRTLLIEFLKKHHDEHLSIAEIHQKLPSVPQATLYRLIDSFEETGIVRKYIIDQNSPACYQYVEDGHCEEHFHLVCEKCGKLIHLHCHETEHFLKHIEDEHGFNIDVRKINFYGICEECQKEAK